MTAGEAGSGVKRTRTETNANENDHGEDFLDMFAEEDDDEDTRESSHDMVTFTRTWAISKEDIAEGFCDAREGDLIADRYKVVETLGKGVFGAVYRVNDIKGSSESEELAVKIMRQGTSYRRTGERECKILEKLRDADEEGKSGCLRIYGQCEHQGHLCLIFELLGQDLRQLLREMGLSKGISLAAVRLYARQIFRALRLLHSCGFVHADVKPDNFLVDRKGAKVKLSDFGTAERAKNLPQNAMVVSRFYRSPEIIIGAPLDVAGSAIDVWAAGCTLYELFTGTVLFPGHDNNDMLRLMQEGLGRIPKRLINKGKFSREHFDVDSGNFVWHPKDSDESRIFVYEEHRHVNDLNARIVKAAGCDSTDVRNFQDLLHHCFDFDPVRRIKAAYALAHHPFLLKHRSKTWKDGKRVKRE
eukprot:Clim_evm49s243 gene=Clim_evmTU49s243